MQGRFRTPAGGRFPAPALTWRLVAALCVLSVACAFLAVGVIGLLATGPEGAVPAPELADAPDGPVHTAGTVDRTWFDGATSSTRVVIRGAPEVEVVVAGARPYRPGDFIEVEGTKEGPLVRASSVRALVDPVDRAAPWLGASAVLLAALSAAPLAGLRERLAHRGGGPAVLERLRAPVRRRREPPDEGAPPPPAQ